MNLKKYKMTSSAESLSYQPDKLFDVPFELSKDELMLNPTCIPTSKKIRRL